MRFDVINDLLYADMVKVRVGTRLHVIRPCDTCIAHNGRTTTRLNLHAIAFNLQIVSVVGTHLVTEFVAEEVDIKAV